MLLNSADALLQCIFWYKKGQKRRRNPLAATIQLVFWGLFASENALQKSIGGVKKQFNASF